MKNLPQNNNLDFSGNGKEEVGAIVSLVYEVTNNSIYRSIWCLFIEYEQPKHGRDTKS